MSRIVSNARKFFCIIVYLFSFRLKIEEEGYAEFTKTSSSSIVVTKETSALVVDTASGETVVKLYDAQKCNNYQRNRACFSYCDQLVLNDGVLWDLRTAKVRRKLTQFLE